MQETVPFQVMPVRLIAVVLVLGLLFAVGLSMACWILFGRRKPASAVTIRPWHLFSEVGWLAAPAVVLATFAGISAFDRFASGSPWDFINIRKVGKTTTSIVDPSSAHSIIRVPYVDPTRVLNAESTIQRPEWVNQVRTTDGISEQIVVFSQQYATREEAEKELSANAAGLLLRDLQQLRPGVAPPTSWNPSAEEIRRSMVKQQYVEATEHDFGSFTHQKYRVWWQVELSPEVRTEFLPSWRRSMTGSRIRRVGAIAASLVLVASLLTMYRRLDVLTQGTRRTRLRLMAGSAAVLWVLAIRFASDQWL